MKFKEYWQKFYAWLNKKWLFNLTIGWWVVIISALIILVVFGVRYLRKRGTKGWK